MPSESPSVQPARTRPGPSLARAGAVGLIAGFLSGLFGVGGGILIVPALVLLLKMDQRLAHGTSLAAVLPIAISSTIGYTVEDKIDWPVTLFIAIGAVAGAVVGTYVLHRLPQRALGFAFAGILAATAVRLLVDHSDAAGRGDLTVASAVGLVLLGIATGILAGLLGVGGGIVMVPAMVVLMHIPPAVAKGTSLAVIVPTSIMGTWRNRNNGNADIPIAVVVGLAGVVSAYLATKLSIGMSETTSNVLFALLLLVVAGRMLWQLLHAAPEAEGTPDGSGAAAESGLDVVGGGEAAARGNGHDLTTGSKERTPAGTDADAAGRDRR
ncbi:MAG TPA: sulfite exporter TauE/SafE family protein [Acidimicrobiales bacterium]